MGGGGQANFTGKCTNFLTGAASPARNGAPARCAGAASAAGERPAGRFPPFPRPRAKGRSRPPRLGRRGPAPAKASAPPRARSRARAGGRGRSAPTRARRNSRGSTAPQGSTGHARGQRISEGSRRGGGRGGRPLGGHSMPRLPQTGGLGGLPMWGDPPRTTRLPAGKPGARGASRESDQHQASGERARRPGGEGAAAAALPGLCRAWLFRGELLLHPLRGGLAAGCSCAAAHPPSGLFLGKIFGVGNDAARRIAAMHIALQVAVHVTIVM